MQQPQIVYVVLYWNYGDQGVEFCGVFATEELAKIYIEKRSRRYNNTQDFTINKEAIQTAVI